jgi:Na+-driven multidrug efflux pump
MSVQVSTPSDTPALVSQKGSVGEVAYLAFPIVVQTISETIMQLIDSAMVWRLGATELGAIGFSGIWIWTLFVPFTGTGQGVQAFVSRHDGADERQLCGPWIWQAIWPLVPAMTVWMFVVALFFPYLVAWVVPSPGLGSGGRVRLRARPAARPWSRTSC